MTRSEDVLESNQIGSPDGRRWTLRTRHAGRASRSYQVEVLRADRMIVTSVVVGDTRREARAASDKLVRLISDGTALFLGPARTP